MKRAREEMSKCVTFPYWSLLIEDMQHLIVREYLDPWTQQCLAVTCKDHVARWYNNEAATGEWMGKYCPTWEWYMDHSLTKTEGILRGIIQARRFSILRELKDDVKSRILRRHGIYHDHHDEALALYKSTLPGYDASSEILKESLFQMAYDAKGQHWGNFQTYWILYDEAIASGYTAEEVLRLQAILPLRSTASLANEKVSSDIFRLFCESGQFQLLSALEGEKTCSDWHHSAANMIRLAKRPIDWDWVRTHHANSFPPFDECLLQPVHQAMSFHAAKSDLIVHNILQTVGLIRQPWRATMSWTFTQWARHTTLNLDKLALFLQSNDTEFIID
jgi:hypothetical protein